MTKSQKYCLAEWPPFLVLPDLPSLNTNSHSLIQVSVTKTPSDHYLQEQKHNIHAARHIYSYVNHRACSIRSNKNAFKTTDPVQHIQIYLRQWHATFPQHATCPQQCNIPTDWYTHNDNTIFKQTNMSNHTRLYITLCDDIAFIQQPNLP